MNIATKKQPYQGTKNQFKFISRNNILGYVYPASGLKIIKTVKS